MKKLKIAMLASNYIRIPPEPADKYLPKGTSGAPELIVHYITEGLVKRGHEVTLFASGDSATAAQLASVTEKATGLTIGHGPHLEYENLLIGQAYQRAEHKEFDIVHSHFDTRSSHFAPLVTTPTVSTLHSPLIGQVKDMLQYYANTQYYISISNNQRKDLPELQYVATCYNGINLDHMPKAETKEDYLVHVGRVTPEKGAFEAIQLAKMTNKKLLLFGSIDPALEYWPSKIKPLIDNEQIIYKGVVGRNELFAYIARAQAFIFPIQWEEPFGLAIIEAMACGTPVIAFRRGAVPEVVVDGKTGFIVDTVEEMAQALKKINEIDSQVCRKHVAENFSINKMVDGYEEAYYKILEHQAKS